MILKLKIKPNRRDNRIVVWIQRNTKFESDLLQIFDFFKENIKISQIRAIHKYYKISSENPAIMMSLISSILEIIPEVYFATENPIGEEELVNIENV
jgi:hypothetical protein